MLKRIATIALWCVAPILIFVSANLYDPYLAMIRGWGDVALAVGELAGIAVLLGCGYWRRGGVAAKLLVLLWCLPPLAMASAVTIFHLRKHAVLQADGPRAQELGRHFIVGYSSFEEISVLAAKGLIGGIYITRHNIGGRSADALRSEIARLQTIRRDAGLPSLIVAADREGGIVSHLSPPLTSLPALATLAALPPAERSAKAEAYGRTHGRELESLGITLNFAPVVDLLRTEASNPLDFNSLISRRAIAGDPQIVSDIAAAYARGLEASGVESHREAFSRVRARPGRHPSLSRRSHHASRRTRSVGLAAVPRGPEPLERLSDGRTCGGRGDRSDEGGVAFQARDQRPVAEAMGLSGHHHHRRSGDGSDLRARRLCGRHRSAQCRGGFAAGRL
jgi:beta-N-acetylhexosaminidase